MLHNLWVKIKTFFIGEAAANSDRINAGILGVISIAFVNLASACPACAPYLTPTVTQTISYCILGIVGVLAHSLGIRDIGAPGETVPGAAVKSISQQIVDQMKQAGQALQPEVPGLLTRLLTGLMAAMAKPSPAPAPSPVTPTPPFQAPSGEWVKTDPSNPAAVIPAGVGSPSAGPQNPPSIAPAPGGQRGDWRDAADPNMKGGGAAGKLAGLLLALLLGASTLAHAGITFGQVSLSPTAAPMVVSVQPFVNGPAFKVSSQGILTNENDVLAGLTILANFGPYNIGLAAAGDRDVTDSITYLAGGVIAGVSPYGEVSLLGRYGGFILSYTIPLGVGAQTTP